MPDEPDAMSVSIGEGQAGELDTISVPVDEPAEDHGHIDHEMYPPETTTTGTVVGAGESAAEALSRLRGNTLSIDGYATRGGYTVGPLRIDDSWYVAWAKGEVINIVQACDSELEARTLARRDYRALTAFEVPG